MEEFEIDTRTAFVKDGRIYVKGDEGCPVKFETVSVERGLGWIITRYKMIFTSEKVGIWRDIPSPPGAMPSGWWWESESRVRLRRCKSWIEALDYFMEKTGQLVSLEEFQRYARIAYPEIASRFDRLSK